MITSTARDEGFRAFHTKGLGINPYTKGSEEFNDYERGFVEARNAWSDED